MFCRMHVRSRILIVSQKQRFVDFYSDTLSTSLHINIIISAPTKEVRAEEGDSCSVLSFCY